MSANMRRVAKKILSFDSLKIVGSVIFLIMMFLLLQKIFVFPDVPTIYDEKIALKVEYTGILQSWSARYDLLDSYGASRRSFTLQIANLSTNPDCRISFTIFPFMPTQDRDYEITIGEVVPQMQLEPTLSKDMDHFSVRLGNNEFIQTITLQVSFNQQSLFSKIPLPYGRVFYQTEVTCNQDILLSKLAITTPIVLTVSELEPSREVASVQYLGLTRTTEIEPQRKNELVVIQLLRETSSLIPLALNFLSMLSIISLVYALYRSISNREHRYIMGLVGSVSAILWIVMTWLIFIS